MGRKTIDIKPIQNKHAKDYALTQRKRGLLKKAIELSLLCEKDIYLVVNDKASNDMIEFSSSPGFDQTAIRTVKDSGVAKHEIYSCDDLEQLKRTNITKYEFSKIFTSIENPAKEPKVEPKVVKEQPRKRTNKKMSKQKIEESYQGKKI